MVQCYAPTDAADLREKESFYSQMNSVVEKIPKGDIQIHLGDFNAKIGSDNEGLERVMGRHGLGQMSENGELFAEFCGNNNMVIENQIDHICISRKWRRRLLDVRNKRSADIASDNHLVIGKIRLRVARVQRREEKIGCRYNIRRLENPEVKSAFVEQLEARASELPPGGTVEEQWTGIKNTFTTTSDETLDKLRSGRRDWITDETWRIVDERRKAKADIGQARTISAKAAARQRYADLEKTVKRSCRRDKRDWTNSLAEEGEIAAASGDIRLLYDIYRRLSGVRTNARMPLKYRAGQLMTERTDQLKRWTEHFGELFRVPSEDDQQNPQRTVPTVRRINRVNSAVPSLAEIEAAIKSMKSNKAPGIDCIPAEMLKADPTVSAQMLHQLFTDIWETATFSADWMQGILVKVPTKEDLSECGN
ncbi:craniofacial development protein 2-like [Toxorhynchites rutilus septentrionalis]|uniref:craniofacial development protein 2-like n=1 Tax=Toxorhynchites rutilus septentrionalis TaxID=329112 RepID=UPI002478F399|nr:craniofacial development protein 2-like [Toxorhynchites rutilus septentrionalis]